jgi:hypothetical protein
VPVHETTLCRSYPGLYSLALRPWRNW